MVYPSGTNVSVTGDVGQGDMPFAEPPTQIDIHFTQPFLPAQISSLQVNVMSECCWTQIVFGFDIYDLVSPPPSNLVKDQVSYGVARWGVKAVLKQTKYMVIQPVTRAITNNVGVVTFDGSPVMSQDLMSDRYYLRIFLESGTYSMQLIETATQRIVWFGDSNIPGELQGIPQEITVEYVGASQGAVLTFTSGSMDVYVSGFQTHDSQANLIEPYPYKVQNSGAPRYVYPDGTIVQWQNETEEGSNLTSAWEDVSAGGTLKAIHIRTAPVVAAVLP